MWFGAMTEAPREVSRRDLFRLRTYLTPRTPEVVHGRIVVDEARCSGCGSCVRCCPVSAIALTPEADADALWFDAAGCNACGACAAACPERAITVQVLAEADAGRVLLARIAPAARCESCGKPLPSGALGDAVAARLAATHPQIAARLQTGRRCADCLGKP